MNFFLIKRSYFCVLHPLLGPKIKFMNFIENQTTLIDSDTPIDSILSSFLSSILLIGLNPKKQIENIVRRLK